MAVNYLTSVPKLLGRDNYDEWSFAVENVFVLEGLDKCIEGTEEDSVLITKAKAKLVLTVDPSLFPHVKDAKTANEVWTKLKNLYDDSGFTRKIGLLRTLISARLENHDSMESYVNQVVETSQKLRRTGFKIDEEWIGSLLLAGLPERFAPMIMAVEHSGISITTDSIKTKLLDMQADGSSSSASAFAANYNQRNKQFKKTWKGGSTSKSLNKDKSNIICFKCKQAGHYMSKCPNNKLDTGLSAVFTTGKFKNTDWYIDSGASVHLTAKKEWLTNERKPDLLEIMVANKTKIPVECAGDVQIKTVINEETFNVLLNNVQYVPDLTTNLLSVGQLISNGNKVIFDKKGCKIYNTNNVLVGTANLENNVYKLSIEKQDVSLLAAAITGKVWHQRLGHINSGYLNKMRELVDGLSYKGQADIEKQNCVVCCEGKQTRLPFPSKGNRAGGLLELIHSDVCGPMEKTSLGGSKYFLTFIDDYSRMCFIYFLKTKDETYEKFIDFKHLVEKQQNKQIKILRTDNGGEYCSKEFEKFLKNNGIVHQKTNSNTPEQNGMAEIFNRIIVEKAKCLLFDENLDKVFWAEACNTACYLKNRSVASGVSKTPFEIWTKKKPDVGHLRIFGSTAMVHVPKANRLKWDKKAIKHILVGYDENTKGYRCYNPDTKKIITSRDVTIMEETKETSIVIESGMEKADVSDSVGDENESLYSTEEQSVEDIEESNSEEKDDDSDYVPDQEPENDIMVLRRSERQKKERTFDDFVTYLSTNTVNETDIDEFPVTTSDALSRPDGHKWKQAMLEEISSFEENETWELVDLPKEGTIVECKWVYKIKCNSESEISYRARLVARGFTQKEGIDYTETFAPVVRHSTLRLLIALAVKLNLKITHLDVKTAFLNGLLEESVYMRQPEGFVLKNHENKVYKLKKAVYGLKQSSRAWNKRVDNFLLDLNYQKSKFEPCLYIKRKNHLLTVVALYVDDFLVFSDDAEERCFLEKQLSLEFKIKNLGEAKQCLGVRIARDYENNCITLDQENYIDQILKKFNMSECKSVSTPMNTDICIDKVESVGDQNLPYQRLIGSLMYLAVLTRPDIAYTVSFLSQFNNCYTELHWKCAKRVLRYLQGTKALKLKFSNDNGELQGYADADWASDRNDRKSYTGLVFKLSGGAISWESNKQRTVALSSTEAEYMSLCEASKEGIYLRNVLSELIKYESSVTIFNDNQSASKLSYNPVFHKRSKHIDVKHHFIREAISNKLVNVKYLPTDEMTADILTKHLSAAKHSKFVKKLGLV